LKKYRSSNYFNGGKFYNDSLNISAKLFGDIQFSKPSRKAYRSFKKVDGLKYGDLLFIGNSYVEPLYDLLFFYNEKQYGQGINKVKPISRLVVQDSTDGSVLFEKIFQDKTISVYLKPKNGRSSVFADTEQIINSVRFDASIEDELSYTDIFNVYKDDSNILFAVHKLNTAPIPKTRQSEWVKFQYLATLLSNVTEYPVYSEIIEKFEEKRKKHLKPIISEVLQKHTGIEKNLEETINHIKSLAANEKIIMLNEMHWTPRHRIFATKLLEALKENGYTYLAVEAVNQDFVSDLNNRKYPTKNSGYNTREPFFGLFIRKAMDMGFEIVGYDEFETDNREKAQAVNLDKIFLKDPHAKVFVYAGIDHILENNANGRRMAEHFREISGIDPLTIDQVELVGFENNEVIFIPSDLVPKNKNINSDVDYFLINNISHTLNQIFDEKDIEHKRFSIEELKPYKNQEIFFSIYFLDEYLKSKSNSVPVLNKIVRVTNEELSLVLPLGNYQIKIWDEADNLIFSNQIEINPPNKLTE